MSLINIKINGNEYQVEQGSTILEAARKASVHIPTLCHMDLHELGYENQVSSCRVCVVEVVGRPALAPACSELCVEGMEIVTDSLRAVSARRTSVELLLSDHPLTCLTCPKNLNCELQALAAELGIEEIRYKGKQTMVKKDTSSKSLVKDPNKCIMCRRCETMCNDIQTCGVLSAVNRGFDVFVGPAFNLDMKDTACTYCGQCVAVCPTGALTEVNNVPKVWDALNNPKKHVVVQVAPAVRVAIGEAFGMEPGTISTGKLASALRALHFDGVFDTDFAADLTIMEEASELIERLGGKGKLPILTSCCPAWVQFFEHQFPDMLDIPSSCESPQIMFGAIAKSYYAEKMQINPDDIVVVSVMPCVAKKFEASRSELSTTGHQNVDISITTRELAKMLKEAGIDFVTLTESEFDNPLGESTGASVIFGTTGGVIEAAVRTAYEWVTNETLENVEFTQLRGMEGIREANVKIGDNDIKIGVAHGLGNARKLLEDIRDGKSEFHAIEIMACPGGCIGGGGQPYHRGDFDIIRKRQQALYNEDKNKTIRKSHENPYIKKLYEEYLGKPNSHKAHELLHTTYTAKEKI